MAGSRRKKFYLITLALLALLLLPAKALAEKNAIDISNINEGYIVVFYTSDTNANFRVSVQMNGSEQFHNYLNGSRANISLPGSSGQMTVTLYEQVDGNSYKKIEEKSFQKTTVTDASMALLQSTTTEAPVLKTSGKEPGGIEITDITEVPTSGGSLSGGGGTWTANRTVPPEFEKYLQSSKEISFSQGDGVSQKAAQLVAGKNTTEAQVMAIYSYIIENYVYDWDLYNAVKSGRVTTYTPDPNNVMAKRKGICYDIASLFAAMARSVGIPTKMVKGNAVAAGGYHAWNSIYEFESLSWVDLDATLNLGGKSSSLYKALGRGYSASSAV